MKVTDPVCAMEIDSDAAHAAEIHEGRKYHFCSAQCRAMFARDPARYATASPAEGEKSADDPHGGRSGHGCCG